MSALRNVPGNNAPMAMGGPSPAVVTPAKASSIFGAISSALRSAKGKRPVSDVRNTVKELLRLYMNQDWVKLPELQLASVKAYEASMSADETEPLTHIYRSILELFGSGLSSLLIQDLAVVLPRTEAELDALKDIMNSHARSAKDVTKPLKSLFKTYPKVASRSAQNVADYEKIVTLVEQAEAGIDSFYKAKVEQIKSAKTFIRESARANAAASRAAASMAAAASRKATRNAATAARATGRNAQKLQTKLAVSVHEVTNADAAWAAFPNRVTAPTNRGAAAWAAYASQKKPAGGRRTRKGRKSNKSRKN